MVMRVVFHACVGTLLFAFLGCECPSGLSATASGMVMADGKPLSGAVITFEPLGSTTGPNGSSPVFKGRFEVGNDAKLHGGTYRVRISMLPTELLQSMPKGLFAETPPSMVIAPMFDTNSELTCELSKGMNDALRFDIQFLNQY